MILLYLDIIMIIARHVFVYPVWKKYHFRIFISSFLFREFQNHKNEHDHGILWVVNAPSYGLNSNNTIENFVNKYMTYDIDGQVPNLYEVQTHCHKNICKKRVATLLVLLFATFFWMFSKYGKMTQVWAV